MQDWMPIKPTLAIDGFAPEYDRTEEGWIKFPADAILRKGIFVEESMVHPAKANIHMVQEIYRWVGETGQTLLDPFGGTGTLMLAAQEGFKVVLLELEPRYAMMQRDSWRKMGEPDGVFFLVGDNRKLLPFPCDHVITSPPYAEIMVANPKAESSVHLAGITYASDISAYSSHPDTIGKLTRFRYNMEMDKVYKLCYESLMPGGTMTIIIKDYMRKGERQYLSRWLFKATKSMGFVPWLWYKRYSPGAGFLKLHKSRGQKVVEDEDIIILRKPATT